MTEWHQISVVKLEVPEASGIAYVGDGRFLVVDDDRGVYLASTDGTATLIASCDAHPLLSELEGICVGPDGAVYVLSEGTGEVMTIPLTPDTHVLGEPTRLGALEHIARKKNKGWEGIALFPGPPVRLLASHEAKPRRIGVFIPDGLATEMILRLPDEIKEAIDDVSDLAVDPKTGHLLLLSDESAAIAEVIPRLQEGIPVALMAGPVTALTLDRKEKAEGICFDEHGTLWVVTDGHPHLRAYRRA